MKLYIFLIAFVMVMGLASGVLTNLPEPIELNDCINLIQVDNVTSETITTIVKPNEIVPIYTNMQKNGTFFNYTFCDNDVYGAYTVNGNDNTGDVWAYDYRVGKEINVSQALMYILILGLIFILLVFSVYAVNRTDKGEWQIFYIATSYLLLFSLSFILWLFSKNYLYNIQLLERIFWIIWLTLSIVFFPFLIGVSAYVLKRQAEGLMEEDYQKQGYSKEDSRNMSKKR